MSKHFTISGLYALTHHDRKNREALLADVEAALKGGAKLIQFRDKTSSSEEKLLRAQALKELCERYQKPLLINDDVKLCIKINAHGVHLGQEDGSIETARKLLGSNKIIGATCHQSPEFAQKAEQDGADYIALGSFYSSKTKPKASLAPLTCIKEVRKVCSLPIVAIGGITLDNAPELLEENVDALAVISELFTANNIEANAKQFSQLFFHH